MTDITVGQNPPRLSSVTAPAHSYLDTPSLWSWLAPQTTSASPSFTRSL